MWRGGCDICAGSRSCALLFSPQETFPELTGCPHSVSTLKAPHGPQVSPAAAVPGAEPSVGITMTRGRAKCLLCARAPTLEHEDSESICPAHSQMPLQSPKDREGRGFDLGGLQTGPWCRAATCARSLFLTTGCLIAPSNEGKWVAGASRATCAPGARSGPLFQPGSDRAPGVGFSPRQECHPPCALGPFCRRRHLA